MFWRKATSGDCLTHKEHFARIDEWARIKPKCMTLDSRKYIHNLITHMSDIVNNLSKLNGKLFNDEIEHWRASKKISKYYDDLFDVLLFFGWSSATRVETMQLEIDSNFTLYNSKWRYFEESIFIWLLIAFVDKLPISRDFIE